LILLLVAFGVYIYYSLKTPRYVYDPSQINNTPIEDPLVKNKEVD